MSRLRALRSILRWLWKDTSSYIQIPQLGNNAEVLEAQRIMGRLGIK